MNPGTMFVYFMNMFSLDLKSKSFSSGRNRFVEPIFANFEAQIEYRTHCLVLEFSIFAERKTKISWNCKFWRALSSKLPIHESTISRRIPYVANEQSDVLLLIFFFYRNIRSYKHVINSNEHYFADVRRLLHINRMLHTMYTHLFSSMSICAQTIVWYFIATY